MTLYVAQLQDMAMGVCGSCYRNDWLADRNWAGKLDEKMCVDCMVTEANADIAKGKRLMMILPQENGRYSVVPFVFAAPGDRHNEVFLFDEIGGKVAAVVEHDERRCKK